MNAQTNAVSEPRFGANAVAESATRATRPLYWSVRRELWENRAIYIAPLAAAGLAVIATLFGAFHGTGMLLSPDSVQQERIIEAQCGFTAMLIMAVATVVAVFYSLDALYGERRDRSIFFWRSLPVSDTVTVFAKASVPLIIIPLLTFAIAALTQYILLGVDAATLAAHGQSVRVIGQVPVLQSQAALLYHLAVIHVLWYAPLFGWLLLVSAWAGRAPILWALVPPFAVEIVEKLAFHTSYFAHFLAYRISGPSFGMRFGVNMSPQRSLSVGQFFAGAQLWGGLAVAAIFLAGVVQLRRYRTQN